MSPPYHYPLFLDPPLQGDVSSTRLPGFYPIILRIYLDQTVPMKRKGRSRRRGERTCRYNFSAP
eukprot:6209180-Pleurochrysis_carterae.AAC.1